MISIFASVALLLYLRAMRASYRRLGSYLIIDPRVVFSSSVMAVYVLPMLMLGQDVFTAFGVWPGVPYVCFAVLLLLFCSGVEPVRFTIAKGPSRRSRRVLSYIRLMPILFISVLAYLYWASAAGGLARLVSTVHGHVGEVTSGIVVQIADWMFLALFPLLVLIQRDMARLPLAGLAVLVVVVFSALEILIFGNRGTTIRIALGVIGFFVWRQGGLNACSIILTCIAGGTVYILPHVRLALFIGADYSIFELLDRIGADIFLGSSASGGNELIVATGIASLARDGAFASEIGFRYLITPFLMIPTELFEFLIGVKPHYQTAGTVVNDLISHQLRWEPGHGSAVTIIGDVFSSFGHLSWIAFLVIGAGIGASSMRSRPLHAEDILKVCIIDVAIVYFVTQDFKQFFWYLSLGMLFFFLVTYRKSS